MKIDGIQSVLVSPYDPVGGARVSSTSGYI